MKTERCPSECGYDQNLGVARWCDDPWHTPEPSVPGTVSSGMLRYLDMKRDSTPAEPSQEAGGAERFWVDHFCKLWNMDPAELDKDQACHFAEAFAAHENQALRAEADAAENDLLRILKALNQPGSHLASIADRAISEIAALQDQLADYITRRMKSLLDDSPWLKDAEIEEAEERDRERKETWEPANYRSATQQFGRWGELWNLAREFKVEVKL